MAAAESCIECDVAIVGAGFAGALIAHELGKARKNVVVLEAGEGVPPNINDYMKRFYMATAKVPESPYTPEIFDADHKLKDPSTVNAGRPTVMSLFPKGGFGDWTDPKQSYLIQKGPRPFASTYDRVAGGTSHWLGTCLRFVPADFKMKTNYPSVPQFVDWPIGYDDLNPWYGKAEEELEARYSAAPLEIGFNSRYLLDIADQIQGEGVQFELSDAGSPTIVRDSDDRSALYVLMPMRV